MAVVKFGQAHTLLYNGHKLRFLTEVSIHCLDTGETTIRWSGLVPATGTEQPYFHDFSDRTRVTVEYVSDGMRTRGVGTITEYRESQSEEPLAFSLIWHRPAPKDGN